MGAQITWGLINEEALLLSEYSLLSESSLPSASSAALIYHEWQRTSNRLWNLPILSPAVGCTHYTLCQEMDWEAEVKDLLTKRLWRKWHFWPRVIEQISWRSTWQFRQRWASLCGRWCSLNWRCGWWGRHEGRGWSHSSLFVWGGARVGLRDRASSFPEFDGPKEMNHEL